MAVRKIIFNDLEVIKGANSTFFTGIDDLVNLNFDPIVSGYAFLYWLQLPSWFEKDPDLKSFKQMTQKNFREFSGLNEITLNTVQHQTGFSGAEFDIVSGISKGNTDFSIGHKEYSGAPMRKLYQKWVSYIRDPRTGIALYPKLFNVEYGARNHSGQLLYVMVRPDVTNTDKNIVEFAAFYTNVVPTVIPIGEYNFTLGQQDSPTITIPFKGFLEIGPDVDELAKRILKDEILKVTDGGDGLPFVDSLGTNQESSALLNTGILKDIFNR